MSSFPIIVSLGLLLGALVLGVTSALALAAAARCLGAWIRWPLAVLAKVGSLFPLSALIWAAIGVWVGLWGWPISSLMLLSGDLGSTDFTLRLAHAIWWWMPPLILLSMPLSAELLAGRLIGKRSLHDHVRLVGLFGIALLPVVEETLHLPGAFAPLIPTLHSFDSAHFAKLLIQPALLVAAWWCAATFWPRSVVPYQPSAEDKIREGAIAIGLSPQEVWKRHLLRGQINRGLARLCSAIAVGTSLWTAYGCPGNSDRSRDFYTAFRAALSDPQAPLLAALPFTLCALSFWLLGRIILPRPR